MRPGLSSCTVCPSIDHLVLNQQHFPPIRTFISFPPITCASLQPHDICALVRARLMCSMSTGVQLEQVVPFWSSRPMSCSGTDVDITPSKAVRPYMQTPQPHTPAAVLANVLTAMHPLQDREAHHFCQTF
jgi:hypothetical protein